VHWCSASITEFFENDGWNGCLNPESCPALRRARRVLLATPVQSRGTSRGIAPIARTGIAQSPRRFAVNPHPGGARLRRAASDPGHFGLAYQSVRTRDVYTDSVVIAAQTPVRTARVS